MLAGHRSFGHPAVSREVLRRLVAARNDDERHSARGRHGSDCLAVTFESAQMIGHGMEALGIAPQRLRDGVDRVRELPHFANQSFQGSRRGRSKDSNELPWRPWRAATQEGEAQADDANMREPRADARQLAAAPKQPSALRRHRQPLGRGIDENKPHHSGRVTGGVGGHDEAAERVAHENARLARGQTGEHDLQFVDDPLERPGRRRRLAPGEAGAIVGTHARERGDRRLHDRPTER